MRVTERGRINPWFIVATFVLFVLVAPVITVAVDVLSALVSTPAFAELAAIVIALLIAAAIVSVALVLKYVLSR